MRSPDLNTLRDLLRQKQEVQVMYNKKDGTSRVVRATLKEGIVPEYTAKGTKAPNDSCIVVWDLDKAQWRSLSKSGVVSYSIEGV